LTTCDARRDDDGHVAVVIAGALDQRGVRFIENEVRAAVVTTATAVTIDCSGCTFVDSSGLRLLIDIRRLAAGRGVELTVEPSARLRQLIEITGLTILLRPTGDTSPD
jgi:anti-sigma B factor antagonist